MRPHGPSCASWLAALVVGGADLGSARASEFLTPKGSHADSVVHHVLVVYDGHTEALVDDLELFSGASSYIWLRAFPSRPVEVRSVEPAVFPNLEAMTDVLEPHHEVLRRNLFGPSVVTLLTRKLFEPPLPAPLPGPRESPNRSLAFSNVAFFEGRAETSTITQRPMLPGDLVRYVQRETMTLDPATESEIAGYLNRGWVIMAAVIRDERPSDSVPARLGPLLFRFGGLAATYPLILDDSSFTKRFRFYLVSQRALAPNSFDTVWHTRPWEIVDRAPGLFHATYNQPIENPGPLQFELTERAAIPIPSEARIVRGDFMSASTARRDLELVETPKSVPLPPGNARGTGNDLFLTLLLSLTPLLYTPESWFLLWLEARARSRAREQATQRRGAELGEGIRLWALYALVVGFFWFFTLEGGGRVAAIAPGVVGIVRLVVARPDREPRPIRVRFRKKKK